MQIKKCETDYNEVKKYIYEKLENNPIVTLATCDKNYRVTSRAMCIIVKGQDVYFQTDSRYLKVQQMEENSKVAINFANIQWEGKASNMGELNSKENKWFLELFKRKHPGSYNMYSMEPDQILYRIEPVLLSAWRYDSSGSSKAFRDFADIENESAYRELYI